MTNPRKTLLISFSGLDGSGKSTQISNLVRALHASGYRTKQLAFWDNVVVGARYREGFVHKAYKSERGIGAPGKPVERRDKNVRRWYLTLARHLLYFADAVNLRFVVGSARLTGANVIILDRYIYDELANLPLSSPLTRAYVRLVNWMVPRPDVAYILDADPEAARARKPEYPVAFMRECRRAYKNLAMMLGGITIIPPLELEAAKAAVLRALEHKAVLKPPAATQTEAQPAA
jgi:thymidylate kinase